jgi:hypothetical protein
MNADDADLICVIRVHLRLIAFADTCGELARIFRTPAWALVRGPAAGR